MFSNKNILVGVTGGIAAYKTCEVVRELIKNNANVKVTMTEAAKQFITPLTFETLTNNAVYCNQFESSTIHIDLARWADCILICPATANTINKVANGIADNLLTTLILAADVPIIFCSAMNKEMYLNPIFQANVEKLRQLNYFFVESGKGELACGEYGWGRLAEKKSITDTVRKVLLGSNELQGKKVVITASRTEEPLDPVRIFTNYASGKMGFALAEAAYLRGADVTLISGPNNLQILNGVNYRQVQTTQQMAESVFDEWQTTDILIMAAAVADFRPKYYSENKIKKTGKSLSIELERTTDILYEAGQKKEKKILIGFALETENEITHATQKLKEKNLDLIVLNNPLEKEAGFGGDSNRVSIIDSRGEITKLPLMSKFQVAQKIMDKIIQMQKK